MSDDQNCQNFIKTQGIWVKFPVVLALLQLKGMLMSATAKAKYGRSLTWLASCGALSGHCPSPGPHTESAHWRNFRNGRRDLCRNWMSGKASSAIHIRCLCHQATGNYSDHAIGHESRKLGRYPAYTALRRQDDGEARLVSALEET